LFLPPYTLGDHHNLFIALSDRFDATGGGLEVSH
jgi:hypothetical protein